MISIVTCSGVTFEVPNERVLFNNLNFSLESKLTALVGPNGVGKTCLARLLAGELEPTEGTIRRHASFRFIHQRKEPKPITVDEFLTLDYTWSALGENLLKGLDRQTLCTHLSGGQWMRVRLAHTLNDQFLILDEPTNDLDREGRDSLLQFLRERDGGTLLISHDRECLQLCEVVLELSNQGLTKHGDGWNAYEESKERERDHSKFQLESAKRDRDQAFADRNEQLARQEKRNRRGKEIGARRGMPKILIGGRKRRAQATTGKIDAATLSRANESVHDAYEVFNNLKIDPIMYADLIGQAIPAQKLVAEVHGFNVHFQNWLYPEDLHFTWRGNVRIALKGPNGSGKSTLLKAIIGNEFQTRGEFRRGQLTSLYIDQRCAQLDDTRSIFENVRDVSNADESEIRNSLAKFLFTKEAVFQQVGSLSGGERLRASLARGLMNNAKPELLILDEPTNNLDLVNIEFLERLVREFKGALLVISHDEVFLKNCGIREEFQFKA